MAGLYGYAYSILAQLPYAAACRAILAGGALRAYFDKTEVKDYDLFFRSEGDFNNSLDAFRADTGFSYQGEAGRTFEFVSLKTGRRFNLIGFAFGTPQETIARFDFRCCAIAAWLDGDRLVRSIVDEGAQEDATARRLVIRNNNGVERTVRRARHYADDYGYTLDELWDRPKPAPVLYEEIVRRRCQQLPASTGGY